MFGARAGGVATDSRAGSHFPRGHRARAILLALLFLLARQPASETGLVLSGYLTPGELVVPGEVTLSLTLQNTSDEAIFNVRIFMQTASGADEISRYDAIAAGEIVEATQVVRVTQAQLDAGEVVVFINSGLETETIAGSGNIGIPIEKVRANVRLEFTRQLSSQYVEEGETITIAYMVRNLGNVDLRQISVHDALGNFEERIASLSPGESKTFLNHAMVGADAQSEAYVTYTPQTETAQRRQDLANVEIYLARESLEVELESNMQDVYYGGQVELTARVTNTGSVTLTAISLTDPALGIFTDKPFSLDPGESQEFTRLATLFARRQFQLTARASSPTGNPVSATSNPIDVAVESESGAVFLSVSAQPEMERIRRAGTVNFTVEIINSGFGSVSNVEIGERALGALHTFAVVPAGEPTSRTVALNVTETGEFQFYCAVRDESGRQSMIYAEPVTVTIASDGEEPSAALQPTESPILAGESTRPDSFNVYPYMIAGALILLAALTTLLAVTSFQSGARGACAKSSARRQKEIACSLDSPKKRFRISRPSAFATTGSSSRPTTIGTCARCASPCSIWRRRWAIPCAPRPGTGNPPWPRALPAQPRYSLFAGQIRLPRLYVPQIPPPRRGARQHAGPVFRYQR